MTWNWVWVAWKLSLNSPLFDAAIWGLLFALLKKKNHSQSAVYRHIVVCSLCCRCVVCVDFRVFRKKNVPFSWWCAFYRISEWTCGQFWFRGDVSETEYSPSESDSNSGMWSHCIGMNFKTFILIVSRSHYLSNNIVTGMLYCTEQLIITIFIQKMTLALVVWSRHKQILPNLVLLDHHPQAHQARGNVTPWMQLPILH